MNSNNPNSMSDQDSSKKNISEVNENLTEFDTTPSATTPDIPSFGWSAYAERINGRFAMIGFSAILIIELFNHSTFFNWAGLG